MVAVPLAGNGTTAVYSVLNVDDRVHRHLRAMRERLGHAAGTAATRWEVTCCGVPVASDATFRSLGAQHPAAHPATRAHARTGEWGICIERARRAGANTAAQTTTQLPSVIGGGNSGQRVTYNFPNAGRVEVRKAYRAGGGGTGTVAWDGAFVLAAYIDAHGLPEGCGVVELGAGLGTPSLVAGLRGAAYVVATDGDAAVLPLLGRNLAQLRGRAAPAAADAVDVVPYSWGDAAGFAAVCEAVAARSGWTSERGGAAADTMADVDAESGCSAASSASCTATPQPPVILAADIIYRGSAAAWAGLIWTLHGLLCPQNCCLLAITERDGRPDARFLKLLRADGFGVARLPPVGTASRLPETTVLYRITRGGGAGGDAAQAPAC